MFLLALFFFAFSISASESTNVTVYTCCPSMQSTTSLSCCDNQTLSDWLCTIMKDCMQKVLIGGGTVCITYGNSSCAPQIVQVPSNECNTTCKIQVPCCAQCCVTTTTAATPTTTTRTTNTAALTRIAASNTNEVTTTTTTTTPPATTTTTPDTTTTTPVTTTTTPATTTTTSATTSTSASQTLAKLVNPSPNPNNEGGSPSPTNDPQQCGCNAALVINDPCGNYRQPLRACIQTCPCNCLRPF